MDNKQNKTKVNRILYVSLVLILCAMAIIIAITSSVNRARRDAASTTAPDMTSSSPSFTSSPGTTSAPQITRGPDTTAEMPTGLTPSSGDSSEKTNDSDDTRGDDPVTPGDGNYNVTEPAKPTLPTFSVPVAGSISKGHDKDTAVYSITMDDWRVHLGVDIACREGDTVRAAADGTISQVWKDPLMGTCVSISHDGAGVSVYKNLAPELPESVTVGAKVKSGEAIGKVGESALLEVAEEPHLHFELSVNGVPVDPMDYFAPESVSTSLDLSRDE